MLSEYPPFKYLNSTVSKKKSNLIGRQNEKKGINLTGFSLAGLEKPLGDDDTRALTGDAICDAFCDGTIVGEMGGTNPAESGGISVSLSDVLVGRSISF